ncbi:MAG TPA: endonuclease/exonuclease/phosphatase family protein [Jatrophihabitans sp.]|nr:endonuclease/exonuclease/phosphatase family protein [Jatrophihabitans sp.]
MHARMAALVTAGALLAGGALAAGPAAAASLRPAPPTGVHLAAVSGSALTVTAHRSRHATGYRLFASSRRRDLHVAAIGRARASRLSRSPRMTVRGLRYSTRPYYFRVEVTSGGKHRFEAAIHTAYLRPPVPRGLRLATAGAPYLTWTPASVTGYVVEQATNAAMTAGRRSYTLRALTNQFTPYGLTRGRTYWFRLRAVNHGTRSLGTAPVHVRATARQQALSVMTYNVLEADTAGQVESGAPLATWSARRPGVVGLIRSRRPDVVAVQEAAAFVAPSTRQVDDLTAALGGTYALARTEIPPTEPGWHRTANYLLYRPDRWQPAGTPGHWDVGDGHSAAYAVLRNRATGARVMVVCTHLAVGNGATYDAVRQRETESLLRQARAAAGGLPIVYAGDFNSDVNRNHAFDGPGRAMRAARVADAEKVAQSSLNGGYNSANLNLRRPPALDQSIDYVYAPPGVAVTRREVVLQLAGGRFPGVIPSDHNPVLASTYVPF